MLFAEDVFSQFGTEVFSACFVIRDILTYCKSRFSDSNSFSSVLFLLFADGMFSQFGVLT